MPDLQILLLLLLLLLLRICCCVATNALSTPSSLLQVRQPSHMASQPKSNF
jgi:hypothetical protein